MNLFDLYAKISLDTGEYDKGVQSAMKSAKNLASHIGSGIKSAASTGGSALKTLGNAAVNVGSTIGTAVSNIAKVGTAAVGVASAGVVALTKTALDNYAEYEQLVGGAELLFGDAYDYILEKASNAYKTVQISQNEYLEQVNGFATGLKTALNGNERAAAELADKIITAEADIVAATGNSQEAVQNAFNGIMKSNYTMLDNLQLGITPTKEGFQELIDTVNEYNKAQGNATNYQIDNLADAQSALLDYIEMQGLAGYASNEAAGTISGSIASVKASWQNLVGAMGSDTADLEYFVDAFVESTKTAAGNVLPVAKTILRGVSSLVSELAPVIADAIPMLVTDVLPSLISAGISILDALILGLIQAAPMLAEQAPAIIRQLLNAFDNLAGTLWDAGAALIEEFGGAFVEVGKTVLVGGAENLIIMLGEKLGASDETINSALEVVQTAWDSGEQIFEAIKSAIEMVAASVSATGITWGDVWSGISQALTIAGSLIGQTITMIGQAIAWLVTEAQTDGTLINMVWKNIQTVISTVFSAIQTIFSIFSAAFSRDWESVWNGCKTLVSTIFTGIKTVISNQLTYWSNLISTKLTGIKNKFTEIFNSAKTIVTNAFNSIKNFLSGSTWSLPKLKLPHLTVSGSFSLNPLSVPSFGISWYKKAMDNAMILNGATIFGSYGNTLLGGGEAGPEVVSGADTLMSMIHEASNVGQEALLDVMLDILELLSGFFPEVLNLLERENGGIDMNELTERVDARLGKIYRRKLREV